MPASRVEDFLELVERARRGRLKLYLGFAAGVGKTSLLAAAVVDGSGGGAITIVRFCGNCGGPRYSSRHQSLLFGGAWLLAPRARARIRVFSAALHMPGLSALGFPPIFFLSRRSPIDRRHVPPLHWPRRVEILFDLFFSNRVFSRPQARLTTPPRRVEIELLIFGFFRWGFVC